MNSTAPTLASLIAPTALVPVRVVAPLVALVITVVLLEPLHRSGIDVT